MFAQKEFGKILEEISQKTPTPGGGTVAAAAGALGCALTIMVCNYTKDKSAKDTIPEIENLKDNFVSLMSQDAMAYEKYVLARKTKEGLQDAIQYCIQVPLEVIKSAIIGLKNLKKIYPFYNVNLKSDYFSALYMFDSAIKSAQRVVEVNLGEVEDEQKKKDYQKQIEKYLIDAQNILNEIEKTEK